MNLTNPIQVWVRFVNTGWQRGTLLGFADEIWPMRVRVENIIYLKAVDDVRVVHPETAKQAGIPA